MDERHEFTLKEHLLYGGILLAFIAVGVPLLLFAIAWGAKGVVWYMELVFTYLPWPTLR